MAYFKDSQDMLALIASPPSVPALIFFRSPQLPVQFRVPVQVMPLHYSFISPSKVTRRTSLLVIDS